jgi:hypothetical protein
MKSDGVSPALLFSLQKTHTRATCLRLSRLLSSKAYKPSFMCGVFVVQNVKCLLAIRRGDLSFMYKYCHLSTSSPSSTLRAVVIKNKMSAAHVRRCCCPKIPDQTGHEEVSRFWDLHVCSLLLLCLDLSTCQNQYPCLLCGAGAVSKKNVEPLDAWGSDQKPVHTPVMLFFLLLLPNKVYSAGWVFKKITSKLQYELGVTGRCYCNTVVFLFPRF